MKKCYSELLIILTIILCIMSGCNSDYTLGDDEHELQENIKSFLSRGSVVAIDSVEIKDIIAMDNMKFIFAIINDDMGLVELKQGFNDKYKIDFISYGSDPFLGRIYETDKSKYVVVYGRNDNMEMDYINVTFDDYEYKLNLPEEQFYLVYCEISSEISVTSPEYMVYEFFNQDDISIYRYGSRERNIPINLE